MNPNNCSTCDHKRRPDGGWCYMFRDEPRDICRRHTNPATTDLGLSINNDSIGFDVLEFGLDIASFIPKGVKNVFKSGGGGDFADAGAGGSWELPDIGEHASTAISAATNAGSSALDMVITVGSGSVELLGNVASGAGDVLGAVIGGAGDILGDL